MSDAEDLSHERPDADRPSARRPSAIRHSIAYQAALGRYEAGRLVEISRALGLAEPPVEASQALAGAIAERLGEPGPSSG